MDYQKINTDQFFNRGAMFWADDDDAPLPEYNHEPHGNYKHHIKVGTKIRIATSDQIKDRDLEQFGLSRATGQLARVTRIGEPHERFPNYGDSLFVELLLDKSSWQVLMKHVAEIYIPIPTINKEGNLE